MKNTIRSRRIGQVPVLEVVPEVSRQELLPLIVYYHGWQINKTLMLTQARKLAGKNFRVILPDAPNHGDRHQAVSPLPSQTFFNSIHGNLFEFDSIIKYFKERHLVDKRIAVGGVSMGGMTASALMTHHPEIQAAACVMGTPCLTQYRNRIFTHAQTLNLPLPKGYLDLTGWVEAYDLSLNPDTLKNRPFFIWHGIQDKKVPIEPIDEFVRTHPHLNIESHFVEADHLVDGPTMDLVADFFDEFFNGGN